MSTFIASALVAGFFIMSGAQAATAPAAPEVPEPTHPTFIVHLTSYNAVVGQTDDDPMTTASGLRSNPETIAARSVDLKQDLPFGTVIAIERAASDTNNCRFSEVESLIGYRVIGDSMNARMKNRVDVLLDHEDKIEVNGKPTNPSRVLGICDEVTVHVVGFIPVKDVPDTQEELRQMVDASAKVALEN